MEQDTFVETFTQSIMAFIVIITINSEQSLKANSMSRGSLSKGWILHNLFDPGGATSFKEPQKNWQIIAWTILRKPQVFESADIILNRAL